MATVGDDIKNAELAQRELWREGPPYEVFKQMRSRARCTGPGVSSSTPRRPASGR